MLERIKYAIINFVAFLLFWGFFCLTANMDMPILVWINFVVALADVWAIDGLNYGKWAYAYLIINRVINFAFILIFAILVNEFYYWLGFTIYCIAAYNFILDQWYMVHDDMVCEDIEDCYQYTMYELNIMLSSHQKAVLEELEQLVDQDKMCIFIATFGANEIQKLLNVELWGIAFLIQKEDFESMMEMVEKMK